MILCYCGDIAATTWRGRPICYVCLLRCVRLAVSDCQPIDEPDLADYVRNRSPLADAPEKSLNVSNMNSQKMNRSLRKKMRDKGISTCEDPWGGRR